MQFECNITLALPRLDEYWAVDLTQGYATEDSSTQNCKSE